MLRSRLDQLDAALDELRGSRRASAIGISVIGRRAVALEPGRLQLARGHLAGQDDLEGALAERDRGRLASWQTRSASVQAVERGSSASRAPPAARSSAGEAIELALRARRASARRGRRSHRWQLATVGEPARASQSSSARRASSRAFAGQRELVRAWCRRELVEVLERDRRLLATLSSTVLALVVEHLLHPEAGGRAVEEAEQGEVVVLGGVRRAA